MMKFSTSSLFGILALASGAAISSPGNGSLVSAQPVLDPLGGNLRMWGFDSSERLTREEASFLEATIQESFNALHEEMGIDLLAHSVAIDETSTANGINGDDNNNNNNHSLLRGNRRLPWNDREMCTYQTGPKVGQSIPGCIFDIDFYMDCYCHLCRDDDFIWDGNQITNPTKFPTPQPTLSPTDHPVMPPTEVGCNMCRDDDFVFDGNKIIKPTRAPTLAPTKKEEIGVTIGLEEERGPDQPFIFLSPPSQNPAGPPRRPNNDNNNSNPIEKDVLKNQPFIFLPPPSQNPAGPPRRPSNDINNSNPIEKDVLKKLQKSKWKRFRKIKKIQFRGWP